MVFFALQKVLSLIRPHLFIYVFIFITLGSGSKRSCYDFCQSVLPIFSSKSFIVSGLTFRSLIYFELNFVYSVRQCYNSILLHVAVQFSQHYLLKRLSFLHCMHLPPLSQTVLCVCYAKLLQSCPTICNLMDGSPPGSSVHRILQVRILE